MIGNGLEVNLPAGTKLLFSRSPKAGERKKELPYWLSMCCQGLSEEFLNNFPSSKRRLQNSLNT
jgi:hypothetical protein